MESIIENGIQSIPYSKEGEKSQDQKLLLPFAYITQIPGKNIRAKLAKAFNYWLNVPDEKMELIQDIVQMLHNASLLLDDIEDNSVLRRGIPVAHSVYGTPSTINAANYVIFIALEKVIDLNHPEANRAFSEQLLELHRGQGMEIYWRDNFICPTEEQYNKMTKQKTGGLFILTLRLMQLFSDNKEDLTKLAGILGLSFQIIDDFKNLHSDVYFKNKTYCEDLSEGKFSFPIVHAIQNHPDDDEIMKILRQLTKDNDVKEYCVSLLEKFGSFEYTKKKIRGLRQEAMQEVKRLGDNPYMDKVIEYIFKDTE